MPQINHNVCTYQMYLLGLCRFDKDGSVLLLHLDKAAGTKVKDGERLTDESGQGQEVKVRGTTAEYRDTHQGAKGLYLGDNDYIRSTHIVISKAIV